MMPAYLPLAVFIGYFVGRLDKGTQRYTEGEKRHTENGKEPIFPSVYLPAFSLCISVFLLITSLTQALQHYSSYAQRPDDTRAVTKLWLQNAPPNATILANWHWATPLWYLQQVENLRPDVTVNYVVPDSDEYGLTWAKQVAAVLAEGRSVMTTNYFPDYFGSLPVSEPVGEGFLFRASQDEIGEMPASFQPFTLTLNNQAQILGYQLTPPVPEIGDEIRLTIAWQPLGEVTPIPFFAHLTEPDGRLVGQADLTATPRANGITLTQFRLTSRPGTAPGNHNLLIGIATDPQRLQIATLRLRTLSLPPYTQNPLYRPMQTLDRTLRIVGYDWDTTLPDHPPRLYMHWQTNDGFRTEIYREDAYQQLTNLTCYRAWGWLAHCPIPPPDPNGEHYVPFGQGIVWTGNPTNQPTNQLTNQLVLPQHFASSRPLNRDLVVSVRLVGYEEDGFHWAWSDLQDGVPALGGIPTLKWITNSHIRDPHLHTIPPDAFPEQEVEGLLRLYDAFTNQPVPILDDRLTTIWLPLGRTNIRN
jgi:hypothetical protein